MLDIAVDDPVRWGVLSAANIGVKTVIPAISASRNGRLDGIASRDRARAEQVASSYPGTRVFASYEALLADSELEAVYIPLPNAMHAEWTLRAAAHGKHVLCEKPMGVTPAQVREMIAACRDAGVLLMEAFMYRFHPQIRWTLEQIAAGRIGPVRLVRSAFAFDIRHRPDDIRLRASLAGGSLMDVGCYPINLCRAIYGGPPASIAASAYAAPGGEVETGVGAVLDFNEGRMGMVDCSFTLPWQQHAEIVGEAGRIVLPRPFTPGHAETVVRVEIADETLERRFAPVDQYQLEVEAFASSVRFGSPSPISPADALEQAETLTRIYQAAGYQEPW